MVRQIALVGVLLLAVSSLLFAQGGPPTPTNLAASEISGSGGALGVQLTWEAPMGLWGFKVYRSVGDPTGFSNVGYSLSRTYIDNLVLPGQTYYYYVTSVTPEMVESSPSNTADITLSGSATVGKVVGKVTDEVTSDPIRNVTIQVLRVDVTPSEWVQVLTDDLGDYEAVVKVGKYVVHAMPSPPSGYIGEWYDNAADSASATPLDVAENATVTANFQLAKEPVGPQGTIAGTVVDSLTQAPLQNVHIMFFKTSDPPGMLSGPLTDAEGKYEALLDPGTYQVRAVPPPASGYGPEWYENAPDQASATPVTVTENATSTVNFDLVEIFVPPPPGVKGKIAGTVTDEVTNAPIEGVRVFFYRMVAPMLRVAKVYTDASGYYEAVLDTSMYIVRFVPAEWAFGTTPAYKDEYYDNVQDPSAATLIHVAEGETFTANAALTPIPEVTLASVEGTVTDEQGAPIANASVAFLKPIQEMEGMAAIIGEAPWPDQTLILDGVGYTRGVMRRVWTDEQGHFMARLPVGFSFIAVAGKWGYLPEYYDGETNPLDADRILVNGDLTGIDFSLAAMPSLDNSVSGVVKDESGKGVPSRVMLLPVRPVPAPVFVRFGHTDENGVYTIGNVLEHQYLVLAAPYSDYAPAFYKEGAFGVTDWEDADTITVVGHITGIDIGVVPISTLGVTTLSGRVTTKAGVPVAGVGVYAKSPSGQVLGYSLTDAEGNYGIQSVEAGAVTVTAERDGYVGDPVAISIAPGSYTASANLQVTSVELPTSVRPTDVKPTVYALNQNYPNPFNPTTMISFDMPDAGTVQLAVFNILGQEIASLLNGAMPAGRHEVSWNGLDRSGSSVSSGVYLYKLTVMSASGTVAHSQVRKMLLMK